MRFVAEGPEIPDDLITARDAGQVLFFCGAGISMGEARLPDFATLAEHVLTLLGSSMESPARRLFTEARRFEKESGLTGLVATDRIFGLLEQEFDAVDVREAVAMALQPKPDAGLGAHRILLDLSRTRGGTPRLVTTNFDLLFEACDPSLESFNPPRLPDPRREGDFRGVIHLHGRVAPTYRSACDDEFVLSSADFGHAYLSEGWATRYIQALLKQFRIVFIGYSADDPPVRYLLEALNRFDRAANRLYAFQAGAAEQAASQWLHKGVEPIAYDAADKHAALWNTLSAWAERARDVDGWHVRLLERAVQGPATMAPHERGMIKHVVSLPEGAKLLATSPHVLPADWLFVLDRRARFAQPSLVDQYDSPSASTAPFDVYGLDSDPQPSPASPDSPFEAREAPAEAWDGLVATSKDYEDLPSSPTAGLRAGWEGTALPDRLWHLGCWIARVAYDPATLRWAAGQPSLHAHIRHLIENSLRREPQKYSQGVQQGWQLLLRSWQQPPAKASYEKHVIEDKGKLFGWSSALTREAMSLYRPVLRVRPAVSASEIVHASVEYPRPYEPIEVPANCQAQAAEYLRLQVEHAIELELQLAGDDHLYFDTLYADDGTAADEDGYGLTGHLVTYTNLIRRLMVEDLESAKREVAHWSKPDAVSTRLRIWTAAQAQLSTRSEAAQVFTSLTDEAFWSERQDRDLLFALRARWHELPADSIEALEQRLLEGPLPVHEEREERDALIAYLRLSRMHWLSIAGVRFTFDYKSEVARLRTMAPDWSEAAVSAVAQPHVSPVRRVEMDTNAAAIEQLPLADILQQAQDLADNRNARLVMRQPFRGLAQKRPVRALRAITVAARKGQFYPWAWQAILSLNAEQLASTRLFVVVAKRLANLPPAQLTEIIYAASGWLRDHAERLSTASPEAYGKLWHTLWQAVKSFQQGESATHTVPRRWVDESLNRPGGHLAEALFSDVHLKSATPTSGLAEAFKTRLTALIELPIHARVHALPIIASRLNWLYYVDAAWAAAHLLPVTEAGSPNRDAFWAGYLWSARTPQPLLYAKLKRQMTELAREPGLSREQAKMLGGMHLLVWINEDYTCDRQLLFSDIEFREMLIHANHDFREAVLTQFTQWTSAPDDKFRPYLIRFLKQVWPKQQALRHKRLAARLADLAFALPELFGDIVPIILPRLVRVHGESVRIDYADLDASIVVNHPEALLNLLWALLDEDANAWPYKTIDLLEELAKQPGVQADFRLEVLQKRARVR